MTVKEKIENKLQEARYILKEERDNKYALSDAILTIHGALEDACRYWLNKPQVKQQENLDPTDKSNVKWNKLLPLSRKYLGWTQTDTDYIDKINKLRNKKAHGTKHIFTPEEVESFLSFVENKIRQGSTFSSSSSQQSDSFKFQDNNSYIPYQYFSNKGSKRGQVSKFRFKVKRTNRGIKIFNSIGYKVICASINTYQAIIQSILIFFGLIAFANILPILPDSILATLINLYMIFIFVYFLIAMAKFFKYGSSTATVTMLIKAFFPIILILEFLLSTFNRGTTLFITPNKIYIGKKCYPIPSGSSYRTILQKNQLYKVGIIQSNGILYFGRDLNLHEAEELLRIITNSQSMIYEEKSIFNIKLNLKDRLIFLKNSRNKLSFVLDYNDILWQSLRCRMIKYNIVELTKSEFDELYRKKLQEFSV